MARGPDEQGFALQVAFENLLAGGVRVSSVTILPGGGHTGSNTVDIVVPLSRRYASAVIERVLMGPLRGADIALVSPEDFILLKVLSDRERDFANAASVVARLGERLDWNLMEGEAELLRSEIPQHDVDRRFRRVCDRR